MGTWIWIWHSASSRTIQISIRQYFMETYVFVMALTFMPVAWDELKLITKVSERITGDLLFRRPVCGLCTPLLALWCSHNSQSRVSVLVRAALFCEALCNYSRPDFIDSLHLYLIFHSTRPYGLDTVLFCNLETIHRIYTILAPSIHNTCKERCFITTGLYLATCFGR